MAVARPSADGTLNGWTDEGGGTTNIYTHINESSPDNTNYVQSPTSAGQEYRHQLSTVTDPRGTNGTQIGWIINFNIKKSASGGSNVNCTVTLYQGNSPGTAIVSKTFTNVSGDDWASQQITLNSAQIAAISDFTNLWIGLSD